MIANGKDGSTEKRDLAAAYGTFMHGEFEKLIINRRYDFDTVPAALLAYMERENLPEKVFSEWLPKVRKDVLAFAQFIKDWNVKPLAVEIGLYHPKFHYAGCLDLPCVMTDPKTGKSFVAIVDFKSGRKGFYEEHELQLHLYREMWNVNYPETPVARVFNFAPKDWRTKPTYNLKDQTDSVNARKLPYLLALASIEDEKRDNTLTIVRGVLDLDNGKIADNILNLSLAELIKTKAAEKDAPEQAAKAPEKTDAPEPAQKGRKRAVKATKEPEPINSPSEPEKPVKTEIPEKLTAYDICDRYCNKKNCDYCLGAHEPKCEKAMKKAGKHYDDPDIFPTLTNDKLPWENEPEPAKPTGPTPEQMAEQAAKDNLLNDEIEL